jgi:lipopolysaccharide transport system permease protein
MKDTKNNQERSDFIEMQPQHSLPVFKPIVVIPPKSIEFPDLFELWESRDLLFFLVKRDLKVRFQQTVVGVLWIALQPLIQMLIFYIILGILVKVPTNGVPYTIFYLSGFIVWQLFTQIVNSSAFSLLGNIGIITKSYFPRIALPLSTTIGALIDFLISFILLLVFLLAGHYSISSRYLVLPFLLLLTIVFSFGIGLLFGALMVGFRDTKNLLGFILQIWMFLSPIMYPTSLAPKEFRILFYLNPLTGLIDAYRWVFLRSDSLPSPVYFLVSFCAAVLCLVVGAVAFRAMENKIADVM